MHDLAIAAQRCIRNRLVEAQGAEFFSVQFVYTRARFYYALEPGGLATQLPAPPR